MENNTGTPPKTSPVRPVESNVTPVPRYNGLEQKKTNRANLENRKSLFFMMGLLLAFSVVFTAFEWGKRDLTFNDVETTQAIIEEEDIEITPPDETPPPPPPAPDQPVVTDVIQIVEDDVKVDNVEFLDTEDAIEKPQDIVFTPPSQERSEEPVSNEVFEYLEEMPEFPGGEAALLKFLQSKIVYPAIAAENNIQGKVYVGFIVERDGSVSDVKVLRPIDPSLDKEAMRVVKLLPKWKPGMQTGKPVRCRFQIPVTFRLRQ